jgi:Flp pilus assembly protein CpaB
MQADSIFVLVLLTAFFGFIGVLAIRSRQQPAATADAPRAGHPEPATAPDIETRSPVSRASSRR